MLFIASKTNSSLIFFQVFLSAHIADTLYALTWAPPHFKSKYNMILFNVAAQNLTNYFTFHDSYKNWQSLLHQQMWCKTNRKYDTKI